MNSWCPGLSDNVSVRLSIHQSELSVLQPFPSVFLGEAPLLKSSCPPRPQMVKDGETEYEDMLRLSPDLESLPRRMYEQMVPRPV